VSIEDEPMFPSLMLTSTSMRSRGFTEKQPIVRTGTYLTWMGFVLIGYNMWREGRGRELQKRSLVL
jgi:hypothetical protein